MSNQREREAQPDLVKVAMLRGELLELLAEEPRTARALADQLSMARSTVHRATETLDDLELVDKSDQQFEITGLGDVAAEELRDLRTNLETASKLEPFLNTIDTSTVDIPLECFSESRVTRSRNRQAHVGVKRIIELIERTDSMRMFSSILSPLYVDAAHREILNGTEIEVVFDQELVDPIVTKYSEEAREAFDTGRFEVLLGADIPFELFLFDDRMGMAAHDESGVARAFVECPSPEAQAWAEDFYRDYADTAEPIDLN